MTGTALDPGDPDLSSFEAGSEDDRTQSDPVPVGIGPGKPGEIDEQSPEPAPGRASRRTELRTESVRLRMRDWQEERQASRRRAEKEADTRHHLALTIIVTLCFSVVGVVILTIIIIIWRPSEADTIREFALPVITGFGPIAGAVIAFYYTEKRLPPGPPSDPPAGRHRPTGS